MATIGSLVVKLSANSAELVKSLTKAERASKNFSKKVQRNLKKTTLAFAAVSTAATGAVAVMISKSNNSIDLLAKTSDKLGVTTEALVGLRHAAHLTGVSQNKLDIALQRLTRRISEAAEGTGVARTALVELGLDAERLNKLSPDAAFKDVADAMAGVSNQSDRVRLGFKLFDRDGVGLINTLALGAEGLDQAASEAVRLGIAINRIDAAKVEAANDAAYKMRQLFVGVSHQLAITFAPMIEDLTTRFTNAGTAAQSFSRNVLSGFRTVAKSFAIVGDGVHYIKSGLDIISASFAVMKNAGIQALAAIAKGLDWLYKKMGEGINFVLSQYQKIAEAGAILPVVGNKFERLGQSIARMKASVSKRFTLDTSGLKIAEESANNVNQKLAQLYQTLFSKRPTESVDAYFDELAQKAAALDAKINATQPEKSALMGASLRAQDNQKQLDSLKQGLLSEEEAIKNSYDKQKRIILDATREGSEERAKLLEKIEIQKNNKLKNLAQKQAKELNTIGYQAKELAGNMEGSFSNAFAGVVKGTATVADAFSSMLNDMAADALSMASRGIFKSILGGVVGSFGGSSFASWFGGGATAAGAKASGGTVAAGQLYRVNEQGAEIFSSGGKDYLMTGKKPGFVTPNHQLGQTVISNQVQNNITIAPTINASGADGEQVSHEVVTTIKHIVNEQIFKLKKQKLLNA
ncbi:phage tail tape measure protein [Piscirickettsia salmonis]|uniref:phage tail tape measure protein n=1 Tax=Piscirickettsia salmonis TaxID=1238 RepID=UPI003EBFE3C7